MTEVKQRRKKMQTDTVRQMLTIEDVLAKIPISRTTLWRMERDKQFPKGHIVRKQKVWYDDEMAAWHDALPEAPVQCVSRGTKQ